MLKLKKQNLNIVLGLVLIGLMYSTPRFLHNVATNVLGRAVLVIVLLYLAVLCDFSCAVIFSLIIIVLFQNTVEGMEEMEETDPVDEEEAVEEEEQAEQEEENQDPFTTKEGNENKDKDNSEEDSTADKGKEKLNDGVGAATGEIGVSLTRPIKSFLGFFSATAQNAKGLTKLATGTMAKEGMETTEGFLGMNLVNDIGKLTRNVGSSLSNITDLDRRLKTSAESNTISSTKDFS